ncbi:MAG: hypothetical protein CMM93_06295 [Rickettsiales bacterium]|nr:hypothetical protein [Rickettsiales bacterium]|tara:strand:- start:943 stop:1263 length:321 start_codon:yes stop_codon:yes gene_type:complete
MIKRHFSLICVLMFAVLALALHMVKFQVQALHDKNMRMQYAVRKEQESIRLLQAEWVVLNHPSRLLSFAEQANSNLQPVSPVQLETWAGLASHPEAAEATTHEAAW